MTITKDKILVYIVLVLLIFTTLFVPINSVYAETVSFDKINVMDDLMQSTINGKKFVAGDYTGQQGKPSLLNFVEFCYEDKLNEKFGLYIYVWSPNQVELSSSGHSVQLATEYNAEGVPTQYNKFSMKLLSTPKDANYKDLFYKFKVQDKSGVENIYIRSKKYADTFGIRRYDISGMELLSKGSTNAIASPIGGSYKFSGYAKGMNGNKASSLKSTVKDMEYIELDVNDTYYRPSSLTGTGLANNVQHNLSSVYFSVPNRYFDTYGNLQKIKAEWWEYQTQVMGFINNKLIADSWVSSGNYNNIIDTLSSLAISDSFFNPSTTFSFNNSFNAKPENCEKAKLFPYMIYDANATSEEFIYSGQALLEYIKGYSAKNEGIDTLYGTVPIGRGAGQEISSVLVKDPATDSKFPTVKDIDSDSKFNMLAIDNRNWWGDFWALFGGKNINDIPNYSDLSPILILDNTSLSGSNAEISKNLCVAESDVDELRDYYDSHKVKNEKVVLFRFAVTEYRASKMFAFDVNSGTSVTKHVGTLAQQSLFFNFSVIQLTFNKDGVYRVIPAVSQPLDIVSDITGWQDDGIDWVKILKIIVGVVLGILLLIILLPLLPHIISLLISIIKLPFILLGKLFGGIGKLFRKKGKSEKKVKNK